MEFTLVMVGSGGVGKTSLTVQLTEGSFDDEYNPTIESTYQKEITVDKDKVLLNILDTAGQEEYAVMRDQHWRTGDGFIVVFDLTNEQSFQEVNNFYENIKKAKETEEFPIVMCGNKCDIKDHRTVKEKDARELAKKNGWYYFETSAKEKINVVEAFQQAVKTIIEYRKACDEQEEQEINSPTGGTVDTVKKKGFFKRLFKGNK